MAKQANKKERFEVPGTIVKCQSGRYLAYYEHRTDIIANGESEAEAKKNLKKMYETIKKTNNQHLKNIKLTYPLPPKPKALAKSFPVFNAIYTLLLFKILD